MKNIRYILFAFLFFTACTPVEQKWVDLDDWTGSDSTLFRVYAHRYTDLSSSFPQDCFLPDGTPLLEYDGTKDTIGLSALEHDDSSGPHRVTSISGAGFIQQFLSQHNNRKLIELSGTYLSWDEDYNPIYLSGKVIMPADGKFRRFILVSHYTIGSNAEAPSNAFSLEGVLAGLGYALVIPDYIGYGITAQKVHPYLVMDITAINVLDMFVSVRGYLKGMGITPQYDDIYLLGYSQGGATTMAVERLIEEDFNSIAAKSDAINIRRVFAGGGPYDVKATYDRFVTTNVADYPVAVPLVLQGMIKGNHLDLKMEDIMQRWLYINMDKWINSKLYTTGQLNMLIGTKITNQLLTPIGMDVTSSEVSELYKAMVSNSIVNYAWTPQAPVYMLHSMDDETVTYLNATNAKQKWKDANITYNFGHYGGHVKTCLRFIFSVKTLLEQDQLEEDYNYVN